MSVVTKNTEKYVTKFIISLFDWYEKLFFDTALNNAFLHTRAS